MYLLDADVVSELRRVRAHRAALARLKCVDDSDLCLGALSIGEIELTREQDRTKAAGLQERLERVGGTLNVLPMDASAFRVFARMMHKRSETLIEDAMIAAIATVRGLIVVTRNVKDFAALDMRTLNPFKRLLQ